MEGNSTYCEPKTGNVNQCVRQEPRLTLPHRGLTICIFGNFMAVSREV